MNSLINVLKFIDLTNISVRKFERDAELPNGTIAAAKESGDLSDSNVEKIIEKYSTELQNQGFNIFDLGQFGKKGRAIISNDQLKQIKKELVDKEEKTNPYIKLLEDNDRFFKTEYHNLLISLNKILEIGMKSEELIKLNLEHIGNVEAHLKEVNPEVVHAQINSQIAGVEVIEQKGKRAGT